MFALASAILCLALLVPAYGEEKGWEKKWQETLEGARREGKVVVLGPADPLVRRELPAKFTARFGVPVEYIGGRGQEVLGRLRIERRANHYTADVMLSGVSSAYLEKILDPLRPELFVPDVVDPTKWKRGSLWFVDPEQSYVLRLLNYLPPIFNINTEKVDAKEIATMRDLLQPKWTGKISIVDPVGGGSGPHYAAVLYHLTGEEFVKKLYIDQKPALNRDTRQLAEWLARGTYPISLGAGSEDTKRLQEEGFPVKRIYGLPDAPGALTAGNGALMLLNRAPHPNAARLFINWMASKEGLEIYSRTRQLATTRNDVDESFVPQEEIPRPNTNYMDASSWEFSMKFDEVSKRMREILRR